MNIANQYRRVRSFTSKLCENLQPEDCVIQSMPDVSPTRWHLAHTTWFFETFVLQTSVDDYRVFSDDFCFLFNSYYNAVGEQYPRDRRGLLSRPTVAEVWEYRQHVDEQMTKLLEQSNTNDVLRVTELGLHHEQQHQELMLTDIKHVLSVNPLYPPLLDPTKSPPSESHHQPLAWCLREPGIVEAGAQGDRFCFDNELPRHEVLLHPHRLANRLVTNGEYMEFVEQGGYQEPSLWLSLGWHTVNQQRWRSPLYWVSLDRKWYEFTLYGLRELQLDEPVTHISFFEADAFARWRSLRLPTEFEWENAAATQPIRGNFADNGPWHPRPYSEQQNASEQPGQLWGDVWEWTSSPYVAYPGYRAPSGALGEYNGKFMCNQYVLRGGSCFTSTDHIRRSYRNFFPPDARWQASGFRLAGELD